mmetsp:Transcript_174097/g.558197  ORF Transcript_174097/g.558197 Transcript_174097/m.558197 type:complete len:250 (-) Transcript_174097:958-1707(-)
MMPTLPKSKSSGSVFPTASGEKWMRAPLGKSPSQVSVLKRVASSRALTSCSTDTCKPASARRLAIFSASTLVCFRATAAPSPRRKCSPRFSAICCSWAQPRCCQDQTSPCGAIAGTTSARKFQLYRSAKDMPDSKKDGSIFRVVLCKLVSVGGSSGNGPKDLSSSCKAFVAARMQSGKEPGISAFAHSNTVMVCVGFHRVSSRPTARVRSMAPCIAMRAACCSPCAGMQRRAPGGVSRTWRSSPASWAK